MTRKRKVHQVTMDEFSKFQERLDRPLFEYDADGDEQAAPVRVSPGPKPGPKPAFAGAKLATTDVELQEAEIRPVPYMRRRIR